MTIYCVRQPPYWIFATYKPDHPASFDNSSDKFLYAILQTNNITASFWILSKE